MQSNGLDMQRFCPECGHVGEVGAENRSCCPDGSSAFMVPAKWANELRAGFKARLAAVQQGVQPALIARLESIALTFASAYEAAGWETYREDVEKRAQKAKQELTAALQSALATHPTQQGPRHGDYASDLKKEGPLVITLENVNDGKQWCATTNHYDFIVIGQNSAQDALSIALKQALAAHPTQQGLDLRQLQEIKRAVDDFANFSETDIDYELLLRAAQARYLECTHFAVWNKAALERDLAAAQAKHGGV